MWLIVGLVVIIGGAVAWWAMSQKPSVPATSSTTEIQQQATQPSSAPSATIDSASLNSSTVQPIITGTAANTGQVSVALTMTDQTGKIIAINPDNRHPSTLVKVVNGRWSYPVDYADFPGFSALSAGTYGVSVSDASGTKVLASGTLTIVAQPSISIDAGSLTSSSAEPTITGTASGVREILISIDYAPPKPTVLFNDEHVSVVNGRWSVKISKSSLLHTDIFPNGLTSGTYHVVAAVPYASPASGTLTITQ